ncbi:MAG: hypothetical protein AM1032_000336 [Mycoplasmataceae bacterium]|nr:MAG: hypothetical protein AM1032_000336 [Mycoplasmataceae bacterium]
MKNEWFRKNKIFDFYQIQINKLISKAKQLESNDDQLIALASFKDIIELFNETFNWNIHEGNNL